MPRPHISRTYDMNEMRMGAMSKLCRYGEVCGYGVWGMWVWVCGYEVCGYEVWGMRYGYVGMWYGVCGYGVCGYEVFGYGAWGM